MAASSQLLKPCLLSAAGHSLFSPISFLSTKPQSLPFFPTKPFLFLSLKKNLPLHTPLVAHTSQWAQQVDVEEYEEEEEELTDAGPTSVPGADPAGFAEEESYVEPPEEAKLYVGNLPYDVDSEALASLFGKAGVVEIAQVIFSRETGQSRGFGFVTMSTVEEADKAVEILDRYDVNGKLLKVNKAAPRGARAERAPREFEPSFRAYVGNLPWQIDDARLEQVFSEHGKVVSAKVVCDRETGRSRGFGFVTMASQTELDDAIAALDGQSLDGRAIRVNVAEERPRRGPF